MFPSRKTEWNHSALSRAGSALWDMHVFLKTCFKAKRKTEPQCSSSASSGGPSLPGFGPLWWCELLREPRVLRVGQRKKAEAFNTQLRIKSTPGQMRCECSPPLTWSNHSAPLAAPKMKAEKQRTGKMHSHCVPTQSLLPLPSLQLCQHTSPHPWPRSFLLSCHPSANKSHSLFNMWIITSGQTNLFESTLPSCAKWKSSMNNVKYSWKLRAEFSVLDK